MTQEQKQIKETFIAAFPGVKCTFDNKTVESSFVYQDGPALQEVQMLLAAYGIQVIRVINAGALGRVAARYLGKFVNADNTFARRGFIEGYITPDHCCTFEQKEQATAYAMSLNASEM
jgi:hypothetical protein